jgi:hypothetical protein
MQFLDHKGNGDYFLIFYNKFDDLTMYIFSWTFCCSSKPMNVMSTCQNIEI